MLAYLSITFADIPEPRPQGARCPSLLLLLITSIYPSPIPHPSSLTSHHSALLLSTLFSAPHPPILLSLLLNLPSLVSLSLFVLSPCPHLSSSFSSLISYAGLIKSPFFCPFSHFVIYPLPLLPLFFLCLLLLPVYLWISIYIRRNPGDSTDTRTQETSPSNAADKH